VFPARNVFGLCGLEWSTILGAFVQYEDATNKVWVISFDTQASLYRIRLERLAPEPGTGVPAYSTTSVGNKMIPGNGTMRRFREVPALRCFVWAAGGRQKPQAFRLKGMDAPTSAILRTAVEYYHAEWNQYFVTAIADEIGKLDAGGFPGWARTGQTFNVYPLDATGSANVCRFFSTAFAPKSTHFYTSDENECDMLKGNPDWQLEGLVFGVARPDAAGDCGTGTLPLYRLYNDGQGGAPNHRYTTSPAIRSQMVAQGWISEGFGANGVAACVPS
jgi:hypothetical protein